MKTYFTKSNKTLTFLSIIIILFLQLGYSYYISVASLGLALFYYKSIRLSKNDKDILNIFIIALTVIISNFFVTIKYPSEMIVYEREFRIFILLALLYIILDAETKLTKQIDFELIIKFVSITLFVIVIIQISSRLLGVVLLIPDSYYTISGDGALAYKVYEMSLDKGFEFRFRPTATFSEPSSLGLILCSLFFLSSYVKQSFQLTVCKILIIITSIISTSLLGVAGIILLLVPRVKASVLVFITILVAMLLVIYGLQNFQIDRLDLIFSGEDESFLTRLILPFTIIGLNFANGDFFGTPFSINAIHFLNLGAYSINEDPPFHNAFLNILINFGLSGIFILYSFLSRLFDKHERIFFIIVASQNGVLFDFGKIFILAFFILGKRYLESRDINTTILNRN